jgi:hypothetical protein
LEYYSATLIIYPFFQACKSAQEVHLGNLSKDKEIEQLKDKVSQLQGQMYRECVSVEEQAKQQAMEYSKVQRRAIGAINDGVSAVILWLFL